LMVTTRLGTPPTAAHPLSRPPLRLVQRTTTQRSSPTLATLPSSVHRRRSVLPPIRVAANLCCRLHTLPLFIRRFICLPRAFSAACISLRSLNLVSWTKAPWARGRFPVDVCVEAPLRRVESSESHLQCLVCTRAGMPRVTEPNNQKESMRSGSTLAWAGTYATQIRASASILVRMRTR